MEIMEISEPPSAPLFSPSMDEVDNIDYRFEEARLQSYKNWPVPYMEPAKLAASGFYYTGEDDKVRCFECRTEIWKWVEGDDPMVDHQRWSRHCRFLRRVACGNVPIGVDPSSIPTPQPRGRDVCGNYGVEYRHGSIPDVPQEIQELPSTARLGSLGGLKHPEYTSYHARLKTFESWPKSMSQTKEQLAEAGFYYMGKGDQTSCYYCGGGLKDWEPDDSPWTQHAKWFPKCDYLLMVKGQEYVNNITGKHILPPSREEVPQTSRSGSMKGSLDDLESTESKSIDDARMCKICYSEELGVVFLPCGHLVACVKCAPNMTICAVCRKPVTMTVRTFFS